MEPTLDGRVLPVGPLGLPGEWAQPAGATGLVLLVRGSGSPRDREPHRQLAGVLHAHQLATLLLDLLSQDESQDRRRVFDIPLLTRRLVDTLDWLREPDGAAPVSGLGAMAVRLFGAGTGAAAALRAAAERPARVSAVVSRGGRVDLVGPLLAQVHTPTLLIAGGADRELLQSSRKALLDLPGEKRLEIVPRANRQFKEPGALDAVAYLAADWFVRHGAPRAWLRTG